MEMKNGNGNEKEQGNEMKMGCIIQHFVATTDTCRTHPETQNAQPGPQSGVNPDPKKPSEPLEPDLSIPGVRIPGTEISLSNSQENSLGNFQEIGPSKMGPGKPNSTQCLAPY